MAYYVNRLEQRGTTTAGGTAAASYLVVFGLDRCGPADRFWTYYNNFRNQLKAAIITFSVTDRMDNQYVYGVEWCGFCLICTMLWGSCTNPWGMEFGLRPAQQHTSPKHSNDDEMQGRNSFQQPYINLVRSCLLIRFFSFILQQFLLVHRTPLDLDSQP